MKLEIKQIIPLAILNAADDHRIEGRTRFQKLVFLVQEEGVTRDMNLYDFIEYDYGPFSKPLLDDLEMLESEDLIEINQTRTFGGSKQYNHKLTAEGADLFEKLLDFEQVSELNEAAKEVVREYNNEKISDILDYVYKKYPRFQEKSVIYK